MAKDKNSYKLDHNYKSEKHKTQLENVNLKKLNAECEKYKK